MGVIEISRWTCDRCGRVEEQNKRNWQPDDWAALGEIVPPKAAPDGFDHVAIICRPCRSDLRTWIDAGTESGQPE